MLRMRLAQMTSAISSSMYCTNCCHFKFDGSGDGSCGEDAEYDKTRYLYMDVVAMVMEAMVEAVETAMVGDR